MIYYLIGLLILGYTRLDGEGLIAACICFAIASAYHMSEAQRTAREFEAWNAGYMQASAELDPARGEEE